MIEFVIISTWAYLKEKKNSRWDSIDVAMIVNILFIFFDHSEKSFFGYYS